MEKTKKFLELLQTESIEDEIKDLYEKINKERFTEGSHMGSGWGWTIILDIEEDIDYTYGNLTNTRMDVYEGNAIEVAYLRDNAEVSTDDMGCIYDLPEEKVAAFKEYLGKQFDLYSNIDPKDKDYEEKKEEYIEENITDWIIFSEFDEETYHEIEKEVWEWCCEEYSYDEITDKLYNLVENLENEIEQYERWEIQ